VRWIVVGVDPLLTGTPWTAAAALSWAADQARRTGAPVRLLHAGDGQVTEEVRTLRRAEQLVLDAAPHTHVHCDASWEPPRTALLHAAHTARLLVVGRRTRAHHGGPGLGSTSTALSAHAACPVVVVPATLDPESRGVVVGTDASAGAAAAVLAAADQAAVLGDDLTIVAGWFPAAVPPTWRPSVHLDHTAAAQAHRRHQLQAAAHLATARHPGLDVRTEFVEGPFASDTLLAYADRARLLVVGRQGRSTLTATVLGSTTRSVLHRAHTPVLVVPPAPTTDDQTDDHTDGTAAHALGEHAGENTAHG
jgi:nucleotide-binding universal stress UspA family protein